MCVYADIYFHANSGHVMLMCQFNNLEAILQTHCLPLQNSIFLLLIIMPVVAILHLLSLCDDYMPPADICVTLDTAWLYNQCCKSTLFRFCFITVVVLMVVSHNICTLGPH